MMAASDGSELPLPDGIANLGNVVRVGDTVRRPASAVTDASRCRRPAGAGIMNR